MGIFEKLFGSKPRTEPRTDEPVVAEGPRVVPRGVGPTPEAETTRIAPLVSNILAALGQSLRPGMSTKDLEARAVALLRESDLDPRMLHFRGFPAAIAISIDDEIVHGIPSPDRMLEEGQLVKLQLGARTQRGTADQGWTFGVGTLSPEKKRLCEVGAKALRDAIGCVKEGARVGDLGAAMQTTLEGAGFSPIRDFVGYRIGAQPMMDPQLKGYGKSGIGARLERGWILHMQTIAAAGGHELSIGEDRWTATTVDGSPGVLFTAVVHVTEHGCDVLSPLLA